MDISLNNFLDCVKFLLNNKSKQESLKYFLVEEDPEGTTIVATDGYSMGVIKLADCTKESVNSYLLDCKGELSTIDVSSFPKWRTLLPSKSVCVGSYSKKELLIEIGSFDHNPWFLSPRLHSLNEIYRVDKKRITKAVKSFFNSKELIKLSLTDNDCVLLSSETESVSKVFLIATVRN